MSLIYAYPLTTTFAGVASLQAAGVAISGNSAPEGIGDSLYISNGWMVANLRETDAHIGDGNRSEITAPSNAIGDDNWYAWDFYADDWPVSPSAKQICVMQMHDTADGGDPAKAPNINIWYDGSYLSLWLPYANPPTENAAQKCIAACKCNQGVVHSITMHVAWSNTGTGTIDWYVDGAVIARRILIGTAYTDITGPYLKLGLYDYMHTGGFGQRVAKFRDVRIYNGAHHPAEINGVPVKTVSFMV